MEIEILLHKEIEKELKDLETLEAGTEEYKSAVEGVTKLMDKAIEMDKMGHEREEHVAQVKRDERNRLIQHILTGVGILVPVGVTIWGTLKCLKFEETGTVTTSIGRGFVNKILPKK